MRIRITFSIRRSRLLPWRYPELLIGLFYRWVYAGNAVFGQQLHDRGWQAGGHRYKLYTFSWLQGAAVQPEKDGLRFTAPLYWQVSSPLPQLMETLLQGIWKEPDVALGQLLLRVEQVEVLPEPTPDRVPMPLRTLSPIVVSTSEADEATGKLRKVFLSPEDPHFSRVIRDNLLRKAHLLGIALSEAEVYLLPVQVRSRLVTVHGVQVRGYEGFFTYEGPMSLFRVGYQAGFGERNGQGFGMVEVK